MPAAYYNEHDKKAAAWLRELIKQGHIAAGEVDERSIKDVKADEIKEFTQCHFFAGIGGWSYALRLAGWPDDVPVWTGSCPCQPFSNAGKRKGTADERHLWPEMFRLIRERTPATIFGEQVASKDGREWLTGVFTDLETLEYAVAGADLCAAGEGAPHIRQRLYWMADANGRNASTERKQRSGEQRQQPESRRSFSGMANTTSIRPHGRIENESGIKTSVPWSGNQQEPTELGNTPSTRPQGEWSEYRAGIEGDLGFVGLAMQTGIPKWNGPTIAISCTDGARRASAESGSFPLAYGLPARVGRLRGYGNAIVPQVAAEFIAASIEATEAINNS
jgi:DNA (cytosine-5)-methyltransferase 1